MNIIKKVSVKTVVGGPTVVRALPDGPIMRVFGVARGTQTGETDNGPYTALIGNFQGVNLATGEVFVGAKAFLPGGFEQMVATALVDADDVKFGFDILKTTDDSSATGYVYSVKALLEPKETDMLSMMAKELPALPEPVKPAAPAPPEPDNKGNKK